MILRIARIGRRRLRGWVSSRIPEVARLFIAGILIAGLACSDTDDADHSRSLRLECMENIRASDISTPDCQSRAIYICLALSKEPSFVTRAIGAVYNVKGIACDFARYAGFDCGPWGYNDCVIATQEICRDHGQFAPCLYESCLASIPQDCAE